MSSFRQVGDLRLPLHTYSRSGPRCHNGGSWLSGASMMDLTQALAVIAYLHDGFDDGYSQEQKAAYDAAMAIIGQSARDMIGEPDQ